MNTIEAAALQAVREYYGEHQRLDVIAVEWRPCADDCSACRKARTFASLIGVDLDKE